MIYYEAEKPEKHNGGDFYPHCFEISTLEAGTEITDFINANDKLKGADYRLRISKKWQPLEGGIKTWPLNTNGRTVYFYVLRFKDRNDAMLFKLQYKN